MVVVGTRNGGDFDRGAGVAASFGAVELACAVVVAVRGLEEVALPRVVDATIGADMPCVGVVLASTVARATAAVSMIGEFGGIFVALISE